MYIRIRFIFALHCHPNIEMANSVASRTWRAEGRNWDRGCNKNVKSCAQGEEDHIRSVIVLQRLDEHQLGGRVKPSAQRKTCCWVELGRVEFYAEFCAVELVHWALQTQLESGDGWLMSCRPERLKRARTSKLFNQSRDQQQRIQRRVVAYV